MPSVRPCARHVTSYARLSPHALIRRDGATSVYLPIPRIMASQAGVNDSHDARLNTPKIEVPEGSSQESTIQPRSRHRGDTLDSVRNYLGLKPEAPVAEDHQSLEHHGLLWSRIRLALREPFAEFFGTFIMVMFGDGSVAQVLLSAGNKTSPGGNGSGQYQSISWG